MYFTNSMHMPVCCLFWRKEVLPSLSLHHQLSSLPGHWTFSFVVSEHLLKGLSLFNVNDPRPSLGNAPLCPRLPRVTPLLANSLFGLICHVLTLAFICLPSTLTLGLFPGSLHYHCIFQKQPALMHHFTWAIFLFALSSHLWLVILPTVFLLWFPLYQPQLSLSH